MTQPGDKTKAASARMAGSMVIAGLVLGAVAAVGIAAAAIIRKPDMDGILGGIFGGLFIGLFIAVGAAWLAIMLVRGPKVPDTIGGEQIVGELKDVLDELEAARLDIVAKINRRAMLRVPLCIGAGIVMIGLGLNSDDPPELFEMASLIVVPALVGYVWASMSLSDAYARMYKDKVLPRLAATFGALSYRQAVQPDLTRFRHEGVFRKFDTAAADDELFGTHRNLPVNIVELKLTYKSGKSRCTEFDGLLLTLDLPRDTGAVTAVISDAGAVGNFLDRQKSQDRKRVALEDPVFEKVYEVYSSDQIAARALLHPAFMEKLLALGELPGFGRPLVLCTGRMLQIAMPKGGVGNLFEAPSFQKPAATRETLVQLRKDVAAALAAADAVIDLDHRFEVMGRA